jgi:hypothetical protein
MQNRTKFLLRIRLNWPAVASLREQDNDDLARDADAEMFSYLVTIRRVGVTVLVGAIGEIEKVNQVFHPAGRLSAANSP